MPAKPSERQYRTMSATMAPPGEGAARRIDSEYYVEGYASTFDDPYVLWEEPDGTKWREQVRASAFEGADMSDVIMQYDHAGHVFARRSNGTLIVEPDEHGLFVAADLSGSQRGRELYEEIKNGLTTRMSWCFTVAAQEMDRQTRTCTITRVRKVYDVSAVSLPADPNTEISARTMLRGETQAARAERVRRARALALARATIAIAGHRGRTRT